MWPARWWYRLGIIIPNANPQHKQRRKNADKHLFIFSVLRAAQDATCWWGTARRFSSTFDYCYILYLAVGIEGSDVFQKRVLKHNCMRTRDHCRNTLLFNRRSVLNVFIRWHPLEVVREPGFHCHVALLDLFGSVCTKSTILTYNNNTLCILQCIFHDIMWKCCVVNIACVICEFKRPGSWTAQEIKYFSIPKCLFVAFNSEWNANILNIFKHGR